MFSLYMIRGMSECGWCIKDSLLYPAGIYPPYMTYITTWHRWGRSAFTYFLYPTRIGG